MNMHVSSARSKAAPVRPFGVGPDALYDWKKGVWREGKFWFDQACADKAAQFFPENLTLTSAEWAGKPFHLEDWQEHDIVRPLFGWKRADGTRRYRRCYCWVARKNGKTELAAGIGHLMLLGDGEPGGQVYAIATDGNQARLVFERATAMVHYSPTLSSELEPYATSIYYAPLNAAFKPLTGRPRGKHGLSASGLIGDEIHEWQSGDLYTFLHDSTSSRRQPLEFLISTAGNKGGYGETVFEECVKIRDGVIDDPETLVVIYAADPDDDWTLESTWLKANPSLGKAKKLESMQSAAKLALQLPRLLNDFKRYQLNIWTDQATLWLPMDYVDDAGAHYGWDHCTGPTPWQELEAKLLGKRCFGAIDLSARVDLSALVWYFPVQPGLEVPALLPRFYKPEKLLAEHSKRDGLPYERWRKEGALTATPGNVVDYDFIKSQLMEDMGKFEVAYAGDTMPPKDQGGVAIDKWNANEMLTWAQKQGIPSVEFPQTMAYLASPTAEMERLVLSNGLHHGNHPVLRQHAKVVAVISDAGGNIKPAKNKSTQRIDGIVASIMAIGIAIKDLGQEREVELYI